MSDNFPRTVKEKTYHPVIISSDLYMLPINTSTILLDSSCIIINTFTFILASRENESTTNTEIERAHVIILVFDVNNLECIKRLKSHWIPRIIKHNDKVKIGRVTSIDSNYFSR